MQHQIEYYACDNYLNVKCIYSIMYSTRVPLSYTICNSYFEFKLAALGDYCVAYMCLMCGRYVG